MRRAPSHIRFRNVRLDAQRALEPARKKLTTLEAQRVVAVYDDTIRKVEMVILLPYLLQSIDRWRVSLGSEIVELLIRHGVIISSYTEIRHEVDKEMERVAAIKKMKAEEKARRAAEGISSSLLLLFESESWLFKPPPRAYPQLLFTLLSLFLLSTAAAAKAARRAERRRKFEEEDYFDEFGEVREFNSESEEEEAVSESSSSSDDNHLHSMMNNLSLVTQQLSHSTRNILRALSLNPIAMSMVLGRPEAVVVVLLLPFTRPSSILSITGRDQKWRCP
jgi:hypothetical protein